MNEQTAHNQPSTSQQIATYGGLALFGLLLMKDQGAPIELPR